MAPDDPQVPDLCERLLPAARRASAHAYAPYSGLKVGAALLAADGSVIAACNVESASFGLTQCAERNALGTAIAEGVAPGTAPALLIYLPGEQALPPCGACRQVMLELLAPGARVLATCDGEERMSWAVEELLPGAFTGLPGDA